jgi:hypothetical protein
MYSHRPLTNFLSWLIEEPERLAQFHSADGFRLLADQHGLSGELQEILRNNDLRAAMEVLREETGGDNVIFFVLMKFVL